MKHIYLLLFAVMCSTTLLAQSRLISLHSAKYDGTKYVPTDSATITYDANNKQVGGNGEYSLNTLKYTENIRLRYGATPKY